MLMTAPTDACRRSLGGGASEAVQHFHRRGEGQQETRAWSRRFRVAERCEERHQPAGCRGARKSEGAGVQVEESPGRVTGHVMETCFTVCRTTALIQWPAIRTSMADVSGRLPVVTKGVPRLGTVLVCDDEEINRALLVRLLQRFGYDVIAVSSGAAAIATLRDKHVDLVLLDVQMPGVNGFDICAQLKAAPYTRLIPVALVTGLNAREHKIRGLKAGADDFIGKPFDPEELQARVASLVQAQAVTPTTSTPPNRSCAALPSSSKPAISSLTATANGSRTTPSRSAPCSDAPLRTLPPSTAAGISMTSARLAFPMRSC